MAAVVFVVAAGLEPGGGAQGSALSPGAALASDSSWRIELTGESFSVWAFEAERLEILNEIARISGAALGGGKALAGRVSLSVTHASVEEVLARLLENTALVFAYEPAHGRYRLIDIQGFDSSGLRQKTAGRSTNNAESIPSDADISIKTPQTPVPALSSASVPGAAGSPTDDQGRMLYKPGEVLAQFKPDIRRERIDTLVEAVGGRLISWLAAGRLATVKLPAGASELAAVRRFYASGLVEIAERQVLRYPLVIPDDPYYSDQWAPAAMGAQTAWKFSQGSPDVVIAVVDTGVALTHPDLSPNIHPNAAELSGTAGLDDDGNGYIDDIYGWDFADDDPLPADLLGHGTHVAGIAAAVGNNGLGVAGVSWHSGVMPLKVLQDGQRLYDGSATIAALTYARQMGARIVNCSYGGPGYSQIEYNQLAALGAAGIVAVCAAGNGNPEGVDADISPFYPAAYDLENIFSVGASTRTDALASYSNYGARSVDLLAPGSSIRSTLPESAGSYGDNSGTSMAAAQLSGALALLWSLKPGLSVSQVRAAIFGSVDPIYAAGGKTVTGGRLNIRNALCVVAATPGDVDCNADVDLADLVLVLQIVAGAKADGCAQCFAATDPDGDGKLSPADAVNIMQRVAGLR